MNTLAKVLAAVVLLVALVSIWAALAGWGAKELKGASQNEPSVRSGSTGQARVYHHGGKR
jgi:hypothetical protein